MTKTRAQLEEEEAVDYAAAILDGLRAVDYAAAILDGLRHDWKALNEDIIDRFSMAALLRIKRRAWQIIEEQKR